MLGTTALTAAEFTCGDGAEAISGAGWHDAAETWNGWHCPCFELGEAQRIAAAVSAFEPEFKLRYNEALDLFEEQADEYNEWNEAATPFEALCADGVTRRLYPLGAWNWTWELADD